MSLSALSIDVLEHVRARPMGVKVVDLQERFRRPLLEVEGAVSQLKRLGYIRQETPGIWIPEPQRVSRCEIEPDHARIADQPPAPVREITVDVQKHIDARGFINDQHAEGRTMKKCAECKIGKGATAFFKGDDTCRQCRKATKRGGRPAAKPAAAEKTERKKLRRIVRKHAKGARRLPNAGGFFASANALLTDLEQLRVSIVAAVDAAKRITARAA